MQFITWLTGGSTTTSYEQPLSATVNNPIDRSLESRFENLESYSLLELQKLYEDLLRRKISKDNPNLQKVMSSIEAMRNDLPLFAKTMAILDKKEEKYSLNRLKLKEQDPTKLFAFNLSLEEVKKIVDERGHELLEITLLTDLDDELVAKIAEKCVNLTSFEVFGFAIPGCTTNSLKEIEKMVKLNTLSLDYSSFRDWTSKDVISLLSQICFQENMTTLTCSVFDCGDSVFPPIAHYKNLNKLTLESGFDYNLMPVLTSPTLQKTVTKLHLKYVYKVTDEMIEALKNFTELKHLEITPREEYVGAGSWFVESQKFQEFLKSSGKNLDVLILGKEVILDAKIMQTIFTLTQLEKLVLANCRSVDLYDEPFSGLQNMTKLSHLTMRRLGDKDNSGFGSLEFSHLAGLPLVELDLSFHRKSGTSLEGWQLLTHGEAAKTLKALSIEGLQTTDIRGEAYNFLGNLSLESLRIKNCGWVNDDVLKSWIGTPLSRTLSELEIRGNALTPEAFVLFNNFPALSVLGLSQNNGIDGVNKAGYYLTENEHLRKNLRGLYIGDVDVELNVMLKLVNDFEKLEVLITACNNGVTREEEKLINDVCEKKGLSYLADGSEVRWRYQSLLQTIKFYKKQRE